jgi:hypothetical protein
MVNQNFMPAKTSKQQRLMGADLARARAGKKTVTGMGAGKLAEWARKPKGGYPGKKKKK